LAFPPLQRALTAKRKRWDAARSKPLMLPEGIYQTSALSLVLLYIFQELEAEAFAIRRLGFPADGEERVARKN
jgi:hypothetical protein